MGIFNRYSREAPPGHPGGVRWNYDGPITYNPDKGLYEDRYGATSFLELRERFQPESTPSAASRVFSGLMESVASVSLVLGVRKGPEPENESDNHPRYDM